MKKLIKHQRQYRKSKKQGRTQFCVRVNEHDDELLGKFVQVVGHIQIMPDLNAFLSAHIIEPALTADFDPIE